MQKGDDMNCDSCPWRDSCQNRPPCYRPYPYQPYPYIPYQPYPYIPQPWYPYPWVITTSVNTWTWAIIGDTRTDGNVPTTFT